MGSIFAVERSDLHGVHRIVKVKAKIGISLARAPK
jgi:hypothetical protein